MRWLLLALLPCLAWAGPYEDAESAHAAADYARAVPLYEQALRTGAPVSPAEVKARLGLALRKVGTDLAAAERWLNAAIAEGDGVVAARARRYLARLYVDRNELDRGQALLEVLRRAGGAPRDQLAVLLELAAVQVLRAQHAAAIETYSDAVETARQIEDEHLEAVALLGLARAVLPTSDYGMVSWLARQAAEIHARRKRWALAAQARVYEAAGLLGAEKYAEARRVAEDALPWVRQNLHDHRAARLVVTYACLRAGDAGCAEAAIAPLLEGDPVEPLLAPVWLARAELALDRGDTDGAARALGVARPLCEGTAAEPTLDALEGMLFAATGRAREAIERFRRSDDANERETLGLNADALTNYFTPVTIRQRETHLRLLLDEQRTDEALDVMARLKSWRLTEELVSSQPRQPPASEAEAGARLDAGSRWLRSGVARPEPLPDVRALRGRLPRDVAVVDYFLLPDELVVTWLTTSDAHIRRVPLPRQRVERSVHELVRLVSNAAPNVDDAAREVASMLLAPIEAELRAAPQRILALVPHRGLHQVPFAMLPFGDGAVLDRWHTFLAPSLGALAGFLGKPARPKEGRLVAVGDPRGDLAGARAEVRELQRRFPDVAALVGPGASEVAVRRLAPSAGVLHFAVHGNPARRGAPAYLELVPGDGHDGRLTADEVASMPVAARLVVLSACDTGRGDANHGDEIAGVLDRAFLRAGADAVVSARWRISDDATRAFMQAFYGALDEGASRVEALGTAQRRLRDGGMPADALAALRRAGPPKACDPSRGVVECAPPTTATPSTHPYYWAAFALVGHHGP